MYMYVYMYIYIYIYMYTYTALQTGVLELFGPPRVHKQRSAGPTPQRRSIILVLLVNIIDLYRYV